MISYKEYKQLQESFGFNLGVTTTQSLGLMGAHTAAGEETQSYEQMLDEAKKKARKKMLAGMGTAPMGDDDDDKDGEVVDPAAVKDDPDAGSDDDAATTDGDDEEEGLDAPKFSKKKMSGDDKCSECGKSPCKCSDVKKKFKEAFLDEMEKDFFASLKSMMAPPKPREFKAVSEEILFNPSDPNFGLVANDASEPLAVAQPGEIGFAPDTILGHPTGGLGSAEGQGFGGYGGMYEGFDITKFFPVKKK
jgi:hypothetical protein